MLERLNKEMDMLKKEKFEAERDLDALGIPMSVISECISMRDCRLGVELTYDDGDTELKKVTNTFITTSYLYNVKL